IDAMAQEGFEPSASLVLSESGLPVAYRARIPGAGIEPAASAFRARRHYHQQLPRIREGGFEPPPPDSKSGRLPLADSRERPAGVAPACRTWQARARPLGQGRINDCFECGI